MELSFALAKADASVYQAKKGTLFYCSNFNFEISMQMQQ